MNRFRDWSADGDLGQQCLDSNGLSVVDGTSKHHAAHASLTQHADHLVSGNRCGFCLSFSRQLSQTYDMFAFGFDAEVSAGIPQFKHGTVISEGSVFPNPSLVLGVDCEGDG